MTGECVVCLFQQGDAVARIAENVKKGVAAVVILEDFDAVVLH